MEKTRKFVKNFIFFIILIAITFYILFKDQDINDIWQALSNVNRWYILIAILSMSGYVLCESINAKRNLQTLKEEVSIINCIKYTLVNIFFSGITPSSTGGQPMEVYYMHKDGVKVSNATLTVLIQSCSFQIVTLSLAIASIFFNISYMTTGLMLLFIIVFILNSIIFILYLVSIFSRRLSNSAINFLVKVLRKFKVKNIEEKEEKYRKGLKSYQASAKYIKANKKVILKTLITTIFQMLFYYSITYWVYRSFGLKEYSIIKIIAMQAFVYTSTSGIPLPGAVGVSEGNFIALFKNVFMQNVVTSAMLLSRGVSFYLLVIASGIVILIDTIKKSYKIGKKKKEGE